MSCALGPVMEMTTEEADFPSRRSLEVSQRGSCVRIKPVLKVVSSSPMFGGGGVGGMPWTINCVVGVSKWTEEVPGIRWRKVEALELRAVALIVSMVMRVILLRVSPSMRWTWVEPRAELIWSRKETVEEGSGVPSRLMRSLLSRRVGVFLSWEEDGLLVVGGAGAAGAWLLGGVGDFFFFAFFATVAHVGAGAGGAGLEGGGGGGGGAGVDPGLGAGVGEGGGSVAASLST
jgi:hypothetical protein